MKLFKYLLASLALIAGTAQANTIFTTELLLNDVNEVGYTSFNVTTAGTFNISATEILNFIDPEIFLFSNPLSATNFIASDNNSGPNNNSLLSLYLGTGSYILATSTFDLTLQEALDGWNSDVKFLKQGFVKIVISSDDGTAKFGHPSAVPVPAAAWLFGSALLGFAGFRRKSV